MSVMTNPAAPKYRRPSLLKTLKKHQASYLMIAPYFILFFFFTVLPVLMSVVVSFTDWNMLEMPNFVGWNNYVKLIIEDDIFMISLKNTLIFAVITGPISYMLCLLFAWNTDVRENGRRWLTVVIVALLIVGIGLQLLWLMTPGRSESWNVSNPALYDWLRRLFTF